MIIICSYDHVMFQVMRSRVSVCVSFSLLTRRPRPCSPASGSRTETLVPSAESVLQSVVSVWLKSGIIWRDGQTKTRQSRLTQTSKLKRKNLTDRQRERDRVRKHEILTTSKVGTRFLCRFGEQFHLM